MNLSPNHDIAPPVADANAVAALVDEYYDHVPSNRARGDVQFYVEEARSANGRVLELACGTGRVLIPIARAGVDITGIDLSNRVLEICRRKLADEPRDVPARTDLVAADMRSFNLNRQFALITTPFRGFQHLKTVDDQMQCLECVRRHLLPDGRFILDVANLSTSTLSDPTLEQEHGNTPEFVMDDGRKVQRKMRFVRRDLFNQLLHMELIYYTTHSDGRVDRSVYAFTMRFMFRFEAEHLLERCGFAIENVYGDYNRAAFGTRYPGELILVARKVQ